MNKVNKVISDPYLFNNFLNIVTEMRKAQKHYFKTKKDKGRAEKELRESKVYEKIVDDFLDNNSELYKPLDTLQDQFVLFMKLVYTTRTLQREYFKSFSQQYLLRSKDGENRIDLFLEGDSEILEGSLNIKPLTEQLELF